MDIRALQIINNLIISETDINKINAYNSLLVIIKTKNIYEADDEKIFVKTLYLEHNFLGVFSYKNTNISTIDDPLEIRLLKNLSANFLYKLDELKDFTDTYISNLIRLNINILSTNNVKQWQNGFTSFVDAIQIDLKIIEYGLVDFQYDLFQDDWICLFQKLYKYDKDIIYDLMRISHDVWDTIKITDFYNEYVNKSKSTSWLFAKLFINNNNDIIKTILFKYLANCKAYDKHYFSLISKMIRIDIPEDKLIEFNIFIKELIRQYINHNIFFINGIDRIPCKVRNISISGHNEDGSYIYACREENTSNTLLKKYLKYKKKYLNLKLTY